MPGEALTASQHTKNQLEALINGDLRAVVNAAFVSKEYPLSHAMNPGLVVDGLGCIGLPLSAREAPVLGSVAKNVGVGVFEIPGEKISFTNQGYDEWLQSKCNKLVSGAIAGEGSQPTYKLQKLVLQYAGSASTTFTEKADAKTKLGNLILVLPSEHTGGRLLLDFAGKTLTIRSETNSRSDTIFVAARSGVVHQLESVKSGYRLSLVYDIVPGPGSDVVSGAEKALMKKLHEVLSDWKERTEDDVKPYLAFLLSSPYSPFGPAPSLKSLKNSDAQLAQRLQSLAGQVGFALYLAQITVRYSYEVDANHYFEEMEGGDRERTVDVTRVVDLDARPVVLPQFQPWGRDIDYSYGEPVETDPESDKFINGPLVDHDLHPDDTSTSVIPASMFNDRETYFENVWYRTALLIWPTKHDLKRSSATPEAEGTAHANKKRRAEY